MKKHTNANHNIVVIIPIIAIIAAIIVFFVVYQQLKPENSTVDAIGSQNSTMATATNTDVPEDIVDNYISETNYTGNLSQFPELYQYPFKKSEAYICNKDLYEQHPDIFDECVKDATQFYEALFNVDYREIVKDKIAYDAKVMTNCDYTSYVTLNWDEENEETLNFYQYIQRITDYFATNMVQMEAKFYTDDSLVYSDYYIYVRGELVFTIYSSEDSESEYEIGKEYKMPMEVAMQRSSDNMENRSIVSFGRATDNTFFLNP